MPARAAMSPMLVSAKPFSMKTALAASSIRDSMSVFPVVFTLFLSVMTVLVLF